MSSHESAVSATISVLDLFSGAGGLTTGFKLASDRYQTVRAVENDRSAAATYEANHGKGTVYCGDIQQWLRSEQVPEVDLVLGGPPCQGFSALGKQGIDDDRNKLWRYYLEAIRRAKPRFFVLENVPAFLKSSQYEEFAKTLESDRFLQQYSFESRILNAAEYGSPQIRKRVILIGYKKSLGFPGFPIISHQERESWKTVAEAFADIDSVVSEIELPDRAAIDGWSGVKGPYMSNELHLSRRYTKLSLDRFSAIKEGGNRFDLPDSLKAKCWLNHKTGSADVMGRLRSDKPSVTIRTEFFKPEKGRYIHPTQPRAITHFEAIRIQGFPDEYLWCGSKVSIARQIGNAVPIKLSEAIGKIILEKF